MLRMGIDTHLITSAKALPLILRRDGGLVVEMTDGTSEYNKNFRRDVGFYYDLVKAAVERITLALAAELDGEKLHGGRGHAGLAALGEDAGGFWRHRGELAGRAEARAALLHLGVAHVRRPGDRGPGRRSRRSGDTRARCSPAPSWPAPTASPTPTAPGPTAGAISWRCRTRACPRPKWATANPTRPGSRRCPPPAAPPASRTARATRPGTCPPPRPAGSARPALRAAARTAPRRRSPPARAG